MNRQYTITVEDFTTTTLTKIGRATEQEMVKNIELLRYQNKPFPGL